MQSDLLACVIFCYYCYYWLGGVWELLQVGLGDYRILATRISCQKWAKP